MYLPSKSRDNLFPTIQQGLACLPPSHSPCSPDLCRCGLNEIRQLWTSDMCDHSMCTCDSHISVSLESPFKG